MTYHKMRRTIISIGIAAGIIFLSGTLGYSIARYNFGKTTQVRESPPLVRTCLAVAGALSIDEKIGQLVVMGVSGGVATRGDITFIKANRIGGVVYLGDNSGGIQATAALSAQLQQAAGGIPLLIAADQEGGKVQRLTGDGFDTISSAAEQALLAPLDLQNKWQRWGEQLRAGGINYNLAPVADLVQPDFVIKNAPIGALGRNYGTDEVVATRGVQAALNGLRQAHVATAVKHFPGLGAVRQNTDFSVTEDSETTDQSASIRVFKSAMQGGADSVMVSLATYAKLDPDNQAVFSKAVITHLLRDKLGWQGVVVSDDLGVAAAAGTVPAVERGIKFLTAGGDMMIVADAISAQSIIDGIKSKAGSDAVFAGELDAHVTRVLRLKSRMELVTACQ